MFQHFVELFFAPWQVPFLTLSPRPDGPVQPQPRSLSASQPLSLRRCSHVCQSPVTPEYRRSKSPAVPTTTQLLHVPNFLLCSTSFTFLAHVFPRLTTNPPFMCIIGSPRLAGVTALETLGRVFPPPRARLLALFKTSVSFSLCLFVFVCFVPP